MTLETDWPLFGLRIETPRLRLRVPRDADLDSLNALAARGIHDPELMPFDVPWTDAPAEQLGRNSLQFHWGLRATWKPERWHSALMAEEGGTVVGIQGMFATDFAVTRQVGTGSWIGKAFQGRGIGKEMRAAVLHLAFAGLGAQRATSGAFEDNAASIAVSRALGYQENGDDIKAPRGKPMRQIRFLLLREVWEGIAGTTSRSTSSNRACQCSAAQRRTADGYLNAPIPVISSPMASMWISLVPS